MDKFWQHHLVIKGIAVLIALMLWMIVSLDEQVGSNVQQAGSTTIDNVKLDVIYDEELYALMELQDSVQVHLTGRRSLLNLNMLRNNHRVFLDLTELGEGSHVVKVQHEGFPRELQVDIIPESVKVFLEKKEARSFSVTIDLAGSPREGFTPGTPILEEEQVHVIAPASILNQIAAVRGFINLDKADKMIHKNVELRVYDALGRELQAEVTPKEIAVQLPIQSPSLKVPWQFQLTGDLPQGLSLVQSNSSIQEIEVFAPMEVLAGLQVVQQELDLGQIQDSGTVMLEVPKGKDWIAVDPQQIPVEVQVAPTQERTLSNIPLSVKGLSENLDLQVLGGSNVVSVRLQGARVRLDELRSDQLKASIDVRNLGVGEYQLPLVVEVTTNRQYYKVIPMEVGVKLVPKGLETLTEPQNDEQGLEGE